MPPRPRSAERRRPPRRPPSRARPRRATRSSAPRATPAPTAPPLGLAEPPHSHIVCRHCGRIARLELQDAERQLLVALAAQHPAGWTVDGIAFSLTGRCPRCRDGAPA